MVDREYEMDHTPQSVKTPRNGCLESDGED